VHDRDLLRERARKEPQAVAQQLLSGVQKAVGPDFNIDPHFTPRYLPLQQRVAFVPDGDLFRAIREGLASVVTDEIDTFTETGIKLKSGDALDADIIVTATGFQLSPMGDITMMVDGETVNWADTITYRGMMFTGIPNLLWVRGYSYYSWTLRVGLIGDVVCRLLEYMRDNHVKRIMPRLRDEDEDLSIGPWTDPKDFNPGYLTRSLHLLPKSGNKPEWRHSQDYSFESKEFPKIDFDDPIFDVQYDEDRRHHNVVKLKHG
jgi:cation diffusion facilitator CzcD-associated flavoprotein CzcO